MEERVINTFEISSERRMLKIKRADGITNDEDFQWSKEDKFFKNFKK